MTGHGHVIPNPDGSKARCGGPALCSVCARELAALKPAGPTETARTALLSFAAELESLVHRPQLPSVSTEAHEYGSGILQGVAEMARQRAEGGPGTPIFGAVPREGLELTDGLTPAQAYEAGVKAERERCAQLAESVGAGYEKRRPCKCGQRTCRGVLLNHHAPFADLIREVPGDGS